MNVLHIFLLFLVIGPTWPKPLEDEDPVKDAAPSDPPVDAGDKAPADAGMNAFNFDAFNFDENPLL